MGREKKNGKWKNKKEEEKVKKKNTQTQSTEERNISIEKHPTQFVICCSCLLHKCICCAMETLRKMWGEKCDG